jgi:hypothetical protein
MRYLILISFFLVISLLSCESKAKEATAGVTKDSIGMKAKENEEYDGAISDFPPDNYYSSDPDDQAYLEFRTKNTHPPYSLDKVEALIEKIKFNEEDETKPLMDSIYALLTFREKFTYHMIHAESYSQICDVMPLPKKSREKLFGYLHEVYGEYNWSERQIEFFKNNKDSVLSLIKESVSRSRRIGLNYKQAIIELEATEMIPFLIETYSADKEDKDILTVLMTLMKNQKYKPFLSSNLYEKLYGDEFSWGSFTDFNQDTGELIIKWATDFYNESHN